MSYTLKAQKRDRVGSRYARKLRQEGRIPCSIQGGDGAHLDLSIEQRELATARRHHQHLFDIEIDGTTETALVREFQYDAFGDEILHVEFRRVVRGQEIEVEVELEFVGNTTEGIVNHLANTILVATLPANIPDSIVIPIERLNLDRVLHAGEIKLPEGMRLVSDPNMPVANLATARGLDVEPAAAEGEPTTPAPLAPEE